MSIISILGTRLVTGIGALAIAGSVAAGSGAAAAPKGDDHHAVRELRHELRDQSKPEREAIVALRKSMAEEYAKDEPDYERMRALQAEIDGHEARIATMRQEAFVAMHDTLTPEQRRRVADNMAAGPKGDKKGKKGKK
ncbi:MAG: periplasmic heavy metal sensor [Myxococcales bacterium]|nr:periplasmic heavy metal sensor [Myxococcales bacterium]